MTDEVPEQSGPSQPWWHSGAEGLPDIESLLGPDGMAAVGGVADEALKLFVVMRDRFAVPPPAEAQPSADTTAPAWTELLGQLASGAVRAVNEIAAAAADSRPRTAAQAPQATGRPTVQTHADDEREGGAVQPGEAAACSYCPVCQAIGLFRSVPMSTRQRLAGSIVEVADAARDLAGNASGAGPNPVVVIPEPAGPGPGEAYASVDDFLRGLTGVPSDSAAPMPGEPDQPDGAGGP